MRSPSSSRKARVVLMRVVFLLGLASMTAADVCAPPANGGCEVGSPNEAFCAWCNRAQFNCYAGAPPAGGCGASAGCPAPCYDACAVDSCSECGTTRCADSSGADISSGPASPDPSGSICYDTLCTSVANDCCTVFNEEMTCQSVWLHRRRNRFLVRGPWSH